MGIFNFFKKIDEKYEGVNINPPPTYPKPPAPRAPPMVAVAPALEIAKFDMLVKQYAAIAANPVELSTNLNEGNKSMNIIDLLKGVFAVVKLVEAAFPDSEGKVKFQHALELINDQAGDFVKDKLPLVTTAINAAVGFFNVIGLFKKKSA